MKSKIIKVSIILIFMMFSAGLFNFCFAWEVGTDIIETNSISFNASFSSTGKADLKFANFTVPEPTVQPTVDNIELEEDTNIAYPEEFISAFNSYNHMKVIDNTKYPNSIIYYFPKNNNDMVYHLYSTTYPTFYPKYSDFTSVSGMAGKLRYDYVEEQWYLGLYPYLYGNYTSIYDKVVDGYYIIENNAFPIYDYNKNLIYEPVQPPSINMEVNQTGSKTGHVTFTPENWTGDMYYIKDDMDELTRLIAEEELSPRHNRVEYYTGPITIDSGEYVMGMLFDETGTMIFSQISNTIEVDSDIMFDDTHRLRIDKSDLDTYYLFVHSPQEGDYIKVSSVPNTASDFNNKAVTINGAMSYNGLSIRSSFINGFNQLTREINITKNTVNYFYLYDVNNNLVDSAVLNTSNYYDGSDFNFDVDLSYGSSASATNPVLGLDDIFWVKVLPTVNISNLDNYELYFRISDFGNIPYVDEEDRAIFLSEDSNLNKNIAIDFNNSNTSFRRIDDSFNNYFYICAFHDVRFTFELQLRSVHGQVLQTKTFTVTLSRNNSVNGTNSSQTDGKEDTFIRNPNELSNGSLNSSDFNFSGLYDLNQEQLTQNVNGLINNTTGFFSIVTTILLLLPPWISSLIFLFLTGLIVITLLRFLRGA